MILRSVLVASCQHTRIPNPRQSKKQLSRRGMRGLEGRGHILEL